MRESQIDAVLAVLRAVKRGDFSARVPVGSIEGPLATVAAELNDLVSRLQSRGCDMLLAQEPTKPETGGSGAYLDSSELLEGKKILIIDDSARHVFALSSLLDDRGARVLWAEDARSGVSLLNKNPDVNLVLVDIVMPEMDARQATREIQAMPRRPALPIIALTKPVDDVLLIAMIQQRLQHEPPRPEPAYA
jgi:CheY-like chemotaxis protein